jgi:hypothetical protein
MFIFIVEYLSDYSSVKTIPSMTSYDIKNVFKGWITESNDVIGCILKGKYLSNLKYCLVVL